MIKKKKNRIILAGGGTGGHLYPAVAVAEQLRKVYPDAEILFVGTKDKIESKVVPKLGFNYKSITISGFSRKLTLKNLLFPFKLIWGLFQSLIINMKFKPTVAIGTGAYVSGPVIWTASLLGAKVILLEQNSYPGITNRILEKVADEIHLSFDDAKKYFRFQSKLQVTGNPIRVNLKLIDKKSALEVFQFDATKKTLLVLGGSLGAESINEAVVKNLDVLNSNNIQVIWQTGDKYFQTYQYLNSPMVRVMPFIENVAAAYSSADLILARAGATTIAEAANLGLPVIFVPSENVAANHQYENAKSLEAVGAANLITDDKISEKLALKVTELIFNNDKLNEYKEKIKLFSKPEAAAIIAESAIKLSE